jgi:hypothetical protein
MKKLSRFQRNVTIVGIVVVVAYLLVFLFLNVTLEDSSVPALVNGITASMSVVVALGGVMIGILFRGDMSNADPEARKSYFLMLSLFIFPLVYPWGSYLALATRQFGFAVKYSLGGYLVALLALISVYLYSAKRWNIEEEKQPEPEKPKTEEGKTTDQPNKRGEKRLSIEALTLVALLISTGFNIYYAYRTDNLQNSLYSLTYFQPSIFSINTTSTLNSLYCARSDTMAVLVGPVAIDLKIVTPYDGVLTINVKTLNTSRISELNSELNMSLPTLNYSEYSPTYLDTTIHQYFISRNVINSVEDHLVVGLTVILKSNWISPNSTEIGFDLGDLMFEANLFAIQKNETMTQTFFEDVYGMFTPTS